MPASPTSAAHMTLSARKLFDAAGGSSGAPPRAGDFVQLPGKQQILVVDAVSDDSAGGATLYLEDPDTPGTLRKETLSADQIPAVRVLRPDGTAPPPALLAGLWGEWILNAARTAVSSALASAPLDPYPHQMSAVYTAGCCHIRGCGYCSLTSPRPSTPARTKSRARCPDAAPARLGCPSGDGSGPRQASHPMTHARRGTPPARASRPGRPRRQLTQPTTGASGDAGVR